MEENEGLALLNQLYEHCQLPEFVARCHWEPGTVALWDNRAMWHLAKNDYPVAHTHHQNQRFVQDLEPVGFVFLYKSYQVGSRAGQRSLLVEVREGTLNGETAHTPAR